MGGLHSDLDPFSAGFDGRAMVAATGDDLYCQVPHWGFVVAGEIGAHYSDGREEVSRAGEVFYLPPGHVPFTGEGAEVIEFSPAAALAEQAEKAAAAFSR
jgi:hypothetical protein